MSIINGFFKQETDEERDERLRLIEEKRREDAAQYERSRAAIDHAITNPSPEVEAFMKRSRNKRRIAGLTAQLAAARKRGFAKTGVDLDTLEWLLDWRSADVV